MLFVRKLVVNHLELELNEWSLFKMVKSKFIKVRCSKCKNEQIVFGNASQIVKCLVCNKEVAYPTGGKSKISARVLEVLE